MLGMVSSERKHELLPFVRQNDTSSTHLEPHSSKHEGYSKSEKSRQWGPLFEGWKFTLFLALIASLVVLLFNVGFLIYAVSHPGDGDQTVVFDGDCHQAQRIDIGLHLLINLLSSSLLGASNFGMQCLSAPTRQNIDRSHKEGGWLDIGVPSVRNLFRVSKNRSFLWLCLAISSLPFHLFYNSAIYPTTAVPAYDVFVGPGSLGQKEWSDVQLSYLYESEIDKSPQSAPSNKTSKARESLLKLFQESKKGTLQNLTTLECISRFGQTYQTNYNNLLLATEDPLVNDSYVHVYTNTVFRVALNTPRNVGNDYDNHTYTYGHSISDYGSSVYTGGGPFDWMCPNTGECLNKFLPIIRSSVENDDCHVSDQLYDGPYASKSPEFKVDYCLAMNMLPHCKLRYSLLFMLLVIAFNMVKSGILL